MAHLLAAAIAALLLPAAVAPAPDPTYAALRAAATSGKAIAVEGLVLERDAFRIRFEKGIFEPLSEVEGESSGAVFTGAGEWTLTPATASERRHLAGRMKQSDLEVVTDRFDRLVLLFTDATAEQIARAGKPGASSGRAGAILEESRRWARKGLKTNLSLRIAADRLRKTPPGNGVFLALVDGDRLPPALLAFDPWNVESLRLGGQLLGGAETALYVDDDRRGGYWYLEHRKEEIAAGITHAPRTLADASHYAVDTTIGRNKKVSAVTTVSFEPLLENLRLAPIHLLGELRIQRVALARAGSDAWAEIPFVQEDEDEDYDAAAILPAGIPSGESLRLRVDYGGSDVVKEYSRGAFFVGARTSWYPNLDVFRDLATFELTFRVPKAYSVIAVGRPVDEKVEGDLRVSRWRTDRPVRVAGFNYGEFVRREKLDESSGMTIRVFTRKNETPESWAEGCEADGINSVRVGTAYFGKLEDSAISLTEQIDWSFGQSWPGLIFQPDVSWLDSTVRQELGLRDAAEYVESVAFHEFAHQWWGHRVGWASYKDDWLSEGFSEFTAALILHHTAGAARYQEFWEKARKAILAKPPGAEIPHDAAGPISMGWRIDTARSPAARFVITYKKGAYVLHMLRMMMREQGSNADARFVAMMTEFAASQKDRSATTADFRKVVEKHMAPSMDLAGDGTMKWFFDQWVDDVEIPRYKTDLTVSKEGDAYRIRGSVSQEAVSKRFLAAVPIYAEFGKNEFGRVGTLPMRGATSIPVDVALKLPKAPRRIVVNAFHDVLARD
jgi:hypothetical protein